MAWQGKKSGEGISRENCFIFWLYTLVPSKSGCCQTFFFHAMLYNCWFLIFFLYSFFQLWLPWKLVTVSGCKERCLVHWLPPCFATSTKTVWIWFHEGHYGKGQNLNPCCIMKHILFYVFDNTYAALCCSWWCCCCCCCCLIIVDAIVLLINGPVGVGINGPVGLGPPLLRWGLQCGSHLVPFKKGCEMGWSCHILGWDGGMIGC